MASFRCMTRTPSPPRDSSPSRTWSISSFETPRYMRIPHCGSKCRYSDGGLCMACQEWKDAKDCHDKEMNAKEAKKKAAAKVAAQRGKSAATALECQCVTCDESQSLSAEHQCAACHEFYKTASGCALRRRDVFCSECSEWLCRLCDKENSSLNFESWRGARQMKRLQTKEKEYLKVCEKCSHADDIAKGDVDKLIFHCSSCVCK